MKSNFYPVGLALLAAVLFGTNAPFSKILLGEAAPLFMVAFLYLGAGIGLGLTQVFCSKKRQEAPLTKKELPWTILMIFLDVLAPFLLMCGLKRTEASNASLLFNFEMVATTVIAAIFFKEFIGRRIWCSIGIITLASILLSVRVSDVSTWHFSSGSLLVIAACCCWGVENNCTRKMSAKSPAEIVVLKGLGSGGTALVIALLSGENFPQNWKSIAGALLLGFIAYGLSIYFYVKAQRYLGASRTSAYYAAAPFAGVLLSMLILQEYPTMTFWIAMMLMLFGVFLSVFERHTHLHHHDKITHNHAHRHDDMHHGHFHNPHVTGWHTHEHGHESCDHIHLHTPDIHHEHLYNSLEADR